MAGTTNVDRETTEITASYVETEVEGYEANIMEWDIDGNELISETTVTMSSNEKREKEEGFVKVKAYDGGYEDREANKEQVEKKQEDKEDKGIDK